MAPVDDLAGVEALFEIFENSDPEFTGAVEGVNAYALAECRIDVEESG